MSQKDPVLWSKNILNALTSDNVQYQASAILSIFQFLEDSGIKKQIKYQLIEQIIPFLSEELGQTESSLHNDCVKLLVKAGLYDFDLVKPLFPIIVQELSSKNRITLKIIMDFMSHMSNTKDPLLLQAFTEIITNSAEWFDKSFLIPILDNFYSVILDKNFQFMHNYYDLLKEAMSKYPPSMQSIVEKITLKKEEYDAFLQAEEEKRLQREREQEERRLIQEKQKTKAAQQKEEQAKQIAKTKNDDNVMKKQKKPHSSIPAIKSQDLESKSEKDLNSTAALEENPLDSSEDQESNLLKTLKRSSPISKPLPNEQSNSSENQESTETTKPGGFTQFGLTKKSTGADSQSFTNFSKLGLKKKN